MAHIKRFLESAQSTDYTVEDFEDIFLELMDIGFKIREFGKKYIDPNSGEPYSRPQPGSVLGYNMLITAEPTNDEEDYDDGLGRRSRHSNFDYIEPKNLTEIQEDFQRIKALYPVVISCLKKTDLLGKLLVESFSRPSYFRISILPKGEVETVSEREGEFHDFYSVVEMTISQTLSHHYEEYEIEKYPKDETIEIKFADNLTRGRFNTVIKNLDVLSSGFKNNIGTRRWVYGFDISSSFAKKSATIKFKSGKHPASGFGGLR